LIRAEDSPLTRQYLDKGRKGGEQPGRKRTNAFNRKGIGKKQEKGFADRCAMRERIKKQKEKQGEGKKAKKNTGRPKVERTEIKGSCCHHLRGKQLCLPNRE